MLTDMQSNIQIFNSPRFGEIRTAGTSDEPKFCLGDLCRCLGLSSKGVNQRLSKEVISTYPLKQQEAYNRCYSLMKMECMMLFLIAGNKKQKHFANG